MKKRIALLLLTVFMVTTLAYPVLADTYSSYSSLRAHNTYGKDYRIVTRDRASSKAVIAIHGGNIEFETDDIASAIAARGGYDYYGFIGLRKGFAMHITSTRFNEAKARRLVAKSSKTVAIHGFGGTSRAITYVGGRDKVLGNKIKSALRAAGFTAVSAPARLAGTAKSNIVNRNRIGKGVQLELSRPMRSKLANSSASFNRYVNAVNRAMK